MIARVTVEEREEDAASSRVDYLINAGEPKRILWAMLVEISVINTHSPFIGVLFQNKYRVG